MNAPLSHYFICTGHNSYLTGNQLSSDCSDVPIIQALNRGVRVIELDIWPNSAKDDVEVLHGGYVVDAIQILLCHVSTSLALEFKFHDTKRHFSITELSLLFLYFFILIVVCKCTLFHTGHWPLQFRSSNVWGLSRNMLFLHLSILW